MMSLSGLQEIPVSHGNIGVDPVSHDSCTIVNLGSCALRLGRTLHFDPERQVFIGDDAANELINQPMRAPWGSMIL